MQRDSVSSSAVKSVGFDAQTGCMEVEFNNGKLYSCKGVTAEEHYNMMSADSKGTFFNKHLRSKVFNRIP